MEKYLKYYILERKKIVIEVLKGPVQLSDYIEFKSAQLRDEKFSPDFNFIIDFRGVDMIFTHELEDKMEQYISFSKLNNVTSPFSMIAVVTDTPDQVVYSTVFNFLDDRIRKYEIFSTMEAAMKWCGLESSDMNMIDFDW